MRWTRSALGLAAGVLLAAGCSSGNGNGGSQPAAQDPPDVGAAPAPTTSIERSPSAPAEPDMAPPTTISTEPAPFGSQAWDDELAQARTAMVETIVEAGWGVGEDGVLRGPGGLTIDLSRCPAGWEDSVGGQEPVAIQPFDVWDALTGGLLPFGSVREGFVTYFWSDHPATGADPGAQAFGLGTVPNTLRGPPPIEMIDPGGALAAAGGYWPEAHAKAVVLADRHCVPLVASLSWPTGSWAAVPLTEHPATTGTALAELAARFADRDYILLLTDPTYPSLLSRDVLVDAFTAETESTIHQVAVGPDGIEHWPQGLDPDRTVVVVADPGNVCLLAIEATASLGHARDIPVLVPPICGGPESSVLPAGGAADEVWTITSWTGLQSNEPIPVEGPVAAQIAHDLGYVPPAGLPNLTVTGWGQAWLVDQWLQVAAELPGGVTRTNLLLAATATDLPHPFLREGIRLRAEGPADPHLIETFQPQHWDVETGEWIDDGRLIDVSGDS